MVYTEFEYCILRSLISPEYTGGHGGGRTDDLRAVVNRQGVLQHRADDLKKEKLLMRSLINSSKRLLAGTGFE